jgi:hypothetical protein
MRWVEHVALMGEEMNMYRVLVGMPEERDHLEYRGVDGMMVSEWMLWRLAGGVWSASSWFRIGPVAGSCKYGDEPAVSGATELVG